ncbi:SRPBCC domain-containing protein [Rubinisphaera margarita]|uniref:SRPBCC domain-containing protein n=1 Tax=Rubinisphaera margarita TaxID=2909586 RepID=UPI001EE94F61|nr:SRPBCC domain-containing protein [Rubinisphaera margarita]MCG6157510.1 SRPBCC domain-containing protein [Rubinisphaera margarita]
MKPAAASTLSDTQVEVIRSFAAPLESVWNVFTQPELVSRWMPSPPGWSMPVSEMDFRIGGTYENRFRDDQTGQEFGLVGEFREIEPMSKIVHHERHYVGTPGVDSDIPSVITITFQETDGVTTVTTLLDYPTPEAREAALATGMIELMEMGYCVIDGLIAG